MIRRNYADTRFGQLHYRSLEASAPEQPPLFLLHPIPYSGRYFETLFGLLGVDRNLYAPDYPGFGASDELPGEPSVERYAAAVEELAASVAPDGAIDLLGFHTGCLVATEMACVNPARIRRIVMVDAPSFDAATRQRFLHETHDHIHLSLRADWLQGHWETDVVKRAGAMSLERAFRFFVDHIGAAAEPADGFRAAFRYECERGMAMLEKPVLVIATNGSLRAASQRAAALIHGAKLVLLDDIRGNAMELGAGAIAGCTREFLDD